MKSLLAILLLISCHAGAGDLYKCGTVYSDLPCEAGQTPPKLRESGLPNLKVTSANDVWIGMSEEAMKAAMHPIRPIVKVNITQTSAGIDKQFVVGRYIETRSYIYTHNGIVTAIQVSR